MRKGVKSCYSDVVILFENIIGTFFLGLHRGSRNIRVSEEQKKIVRDGFEPPTSRLWAWHSTTELTHLCSTCYTGNIVDF